MPLRKTSHLATSFIYGSNYDLEEEELLNSIALESEYVQGWGSLYGRYEVLQRAAHELGLETEFGHADFRVQSATLGAAWKPLTMRSPELLIGFQGTASLHEEELNPYYGEFPLSFEVYLTLRPGKMAHKMGMDGKKKGPRHPERLPNGESSGDAPEPHGGGHEGH